MKYLLEINGKFYDIKLEMGETKQLEYQKGEFVNVTASTISEEPTLTKTGSGFLRLEFSNGKVCEQLANIARPIDGLTEQEKECVRIAMRITQLRKQQGMTQAQLAEATGILQPNIARIEAGRYGITLDVLARIAQALGKHIDLV